MADERIKASLRQGFSAAVPGYERWATAQRRAAQHLISLLPERMFGKVLDLGCGTGFVLEALFESGRARHVTGVDLAPEMVKYCQRRWPEQDFVCADAEDFAPACPCDLILSSFAFQWLERIPAAVEKYYSSLEKGGLFALALPVSGSLYQLQAAALAANAKPLHLLEFPEPEALDAAFRALGTHHFYRETQEVTAWFDTPLDAVRSLKGIGAAFGGGTVYSVREMRRFLAEYGKSFFIPGRGCPVTYRVWFGVAEKG